MKIFGLIIIAGFAVLLILNLLHSIRISRLYLNHIQDDKINDGLREAHTLDAILSILSVHGKVDIDFINLELRKCGYPLNIPETKEKLLNIESDGYLTITNGNVKLN